MAGDYLAELAQCIHGTQMPLWTMAKATRLWARVMMISCVPSQSSITTATTLRSTVLSPRCAVGLFADGVSTR